MYWFPHGIFFIGALTVVSAPHRPRLLRRGRRGSLTKGPHRAALQPGTWYHSINWVWPSCLAGMKEGWPGKLEWVAWPGANPSGAVTPCSRSQCLEWGVQPQWTRATAVGWMHGGLACQLLSPTGPPLIGNFFWGGPSVSKRGWYFPLSYGSCENNSSHFSRKWGTQNQWLPLKILTDVTYPTSHRKSVAEPWWHPALLPVFCLNYNIIIFLKEREEK